MKGSIRKQKAIYTKMVFLHLDLKKENYSYYMKCFSGANIY